MSVPPPAAAEERDEAAAAPLGPADLAARLAAFAPFESAPEMAVAVSGGADSLALAHLARGWAAARGGRAVALVVDHGLRVGSADEAERVVGWLRAWAIPVERLTWTGPKPETGVQAAARAARHRLLEAACRRRGVLHLLLAHHAGDQAETVAMRAGRGSGPAGLAGMAAVVERPGLRLLRPLLDVPGGRLAATLRALGQPWLEDPSNRDARFRRAALRADPTFRADRWAALGRDRAAARAGLDRELARLLARAARPHPLGQVDVDRGAWEVASPELRAAALARLLATVGGAGYPLAPARLRDAAPPGGRATIGGCVVDVGRNRMTVAREPGRIVDRGPLAPGGERLWDRRFVVRRPPGDGAPEPAGPDPAALELAALGEHGRRMLPGRVREALRAAGVSTWTIASLPALWAGGRLAGCPPLEALGLAPPGGPRASAALRPSYPLAGPAFRGANVVSNPQRPIYPRRAVAGSMPGTLGAVSR